MIELTRLNGNKFSVNCDAIKYIEATPDTTLTLTTGEKLLVVESCNAVVERCVEFRAMVLRVAWPDALMFLSGTPLPDPNGRSAHAGSSHTSNS